LENVLPPLPLLVRIVVTWLAIFPLVILVGLALAPLVNGWPGIVQTAVLMTVVVPLAVIWVVPALTKAAVRLRARGASSTAAE
jgi:hypothetical protein